MGNIYTRDIKRIGQEILELYKDKVTTDYEKNKELVRQVVEVYSKKRSGTELLVISQEKLNKLKGQLKFLKIKKSSRSEMVRLILKGPL